MRRLRRFGAIALLLAVVAAAFLSEGFPVTRVDPADRGLWVSNASRQAVGRVNTAIDRLDTAMPTATGNVSVVQAGASALLVDRADAELSVIDPAHAELTSTVDLPPGAPDVLSDGTVVVIHVPGTGATWIVPLKTLAGYDADSEPTLDFGAGSVLSLAADGRMVAFSAAAGTVSVLDARTADAAPRTRPIALAADDGIAVTSVGSSWALLDPRERTLILPDRTVDLARFLAPGSGARLQAPSEDGSAVLIASTGGLLEVPLREGEPRALLSLPQAAAATAQPIVVDDCAYATWSDGGLWRRCSGEDASTSTLPGLAGQTGLSLRSDGTAVVVTDGFTGSVWTVAGHEIGRDDWAALLDAEPAPTTPTDESSAGYDTDKDPQPPSAVDDDFGARPARSTLLPVLLNDSDPNGDALVISTVGTPAQGRIEVVSNGQQLQLVLPEGASGALTVPYTIDDGRGGSASASVTVTVRGDGENAPPTQARSTAMDVATGGRGRQNVLSDWMDPDGDPFYLAAASGAPADAVSFEPSGSVTFGDGTGEPVATVGLLVSDGRASGSGSVSISTHPAADVPMRADAFAVRAAVGQEVTVSPLEHIKGGGTSPVLAAVTPVDGAVVTLDAADGTFRFRTATAGTRTVEYTVGDGARSIRGTVRIDAVAAPDSPGPPVTVAHTAFVRGDATTDLDVLAQDTDPAGGVLVVTAVQDVPTDAGIHVQVIDDAILRVTLSRPLGAATAGFHYTVTNGRAQAQGDVTIVEVDPAATVPAPIAVDDAASVRVGAVVDIPVLANDVAGDGGTLSLDPALVRDVPAGSGLLFVDGDRLRLLAPPTPGTLTASYRVDGEDGQWSTAQVRINVREADAAANSAPVPETVAARVFAGQTVRIPIPLEDIDPDGDQVRLLGQQSSPDLGSVTAIDGAVISYRAGEETSGTDSFQYTVVDGLGARSTGLVRVGIAAAPAGYRQPVAVNDDVAARPGFGVTAPVLRNDVDPDGTGLSIEHVESVDGRAQADVEGDLIRVHPLAEPGRYGFVYTVMDRHGGTSSAFLSIDVAADAPLARPEVADRTLGLSDVVGRRSIDVPVLEHLVFADGDASDVVLSLVSGFDTDVAVVGADALRIPVRDGAQVVPFAVARADDPTIVAHAFVFVAGARDSLPQLRSDAATLTVPSGTDLTVVVADVVVAAAGRTARISDPNSVQATHAEGSAYVDEGTVRFHSVDGYVGPASLSFDVTDDAADPPSTGRVSTIVLPVQVTATGREAPKFVGTTIDLEPGGSRSIDLARLTTPVDELGADALKADPVRFTVLDPAPVGVVATLTGRTLDLSTADGMSAGTATSVLVAVADRDGRGSTGRVDIRIVGSTRPFAVAPDERVVVPRGGSAVVDVLADAQATNPFPDTPLRLAEVTGLDSARLPAGLSTVVGDDGTLAIAADASAAAGAAVARYRLLDATGDPARSVWGRIEVVVQDRPAPVTGVALRAAGDRNLTLAWTPGTDNFAPITGFRVVAAAADGRVVSTTACPSTSCTVPTDGNGPDNAVRLSVIATNAVGDSAPAGPADVVWSDVVPDAPSELRAAPLDGGFRLSWNAPEVAEGASAITSYVVSVAGQDTVVPAGDGRLSRDFVGPAYPNGTAVAVSVSARNLALPYVTEWNSATVSVTPYGAPAASTVTADANPERGEVTVSWSAFDPRGDPLLGYVVQRVTDETVPSGAQRCTVSEPAPGEVALPVVGGTVAEQVIQSPQGTLTRTFTGLGAEDTRYAFVVWGYNRAGCSASAVVSATPRPTPGAIDDVAGEMRWQGDVLDYVVTGIAPTADRYDVRPVDAHGEPSGDAARLQPGSAPRAAWNGAFGSAVRFQVRACSVWGGYAACGGWSKTIVAPEPSLDFRPADLEFDNGRWSWTADPPNRALPATFACGAKGDETPRGTVTEHGCTLSRSPDGGWLDVTIDGREHRFVR